MEEDIKMKPIYRKRHSNAFDTLMIKTENVRIAKCGQGCRAGTTHFSKQYREKMEERQSHGLNNSTLVIT